jgi:hypothetical protein
VTVIAGTAQQSPFAPVGDRLVKCSGSLSSRSPSQSMLDAWADRLLSVVHLKQADLDFTRGKVVATVGVDVTV